MTLSDHESGKLGVKFFKQISLIMLVSFVERSNSAGNHVGRGIFLGVSKLAGPQHSPFWGFPSIYAYTLNYQF